MGILEKVGEARRKRQAEAIEAYRAALWEQTADANELLSLAESAGYGDRLEADIQAVEQARVQIARAKRYETLRKTHEAAITAVEKAQVERDEAVERADAALRQSRAAAAEAREALGAAEQAIQDLLALHESRPEIIEASRLPKSVIDARARQEREGRDEAIRAELSRARERLRKSQKVLQDAEENGHPRRAAHRMLAEIGIDTTDPITDEKIMGRLRQAVRDAESEVARLEADLAGLNGQAEGGEKTKNAAKGGDKG